MSDFQSLLVGDEAARLYVAGAAGPRVVLFHAWWGLVDDVVAYADRLAGAGFAVVAPDLVHGRTASKVEDAERIVEECDQGHADAVALATIDRFGAARVGAVGFSFGAAWSLWCAAKRPSVAASVAYYGSLQGPSLAAGNVPVLGHFAESDPYETDDAVEAFERVLVEAGRAVTIHRYPGTGHWFAEPSRDAYRAEAANLAFERTVAFLRKQLA